MNIITKRVRLVDNPSPFIGTILTVDIPDDSLNYGIYRVTWLNGEDGVNVDWGDGTIERLTSPLRNTHTYPKGGVYRIRFADTLQRITMSCHASTFRTDYAHKLIGFWSNTEKYTTIPTYFAAGCTNLAEFELIRHCVVTIGMQAFTDCTSLPARLDFPSVNVLTGSTPETEPFAGCTQVTEIHFAAANEALIRNTDAFQADPKLGTGNPNVCIFDL